MYQRFSRSADFFLPAILVFWKIGCLANVRAAASMILDKAESEQAPFSKCARLSVLCSVTYAQRMHVCRQWILAFDGLQPSSWSGASGFPLRSRCQNWKLFLGKRGKRGKRRRRNAYNKDMYCNALALIE